MRVRCGCGFGFAEGLRAVLGHEVLDVVSVELHKIERDPIRGADAREDEVDRPRERGMEKVG